MVQFGGNEFTQFSVPLVFLDRYFLLEATEPPLLSVFVLVDGEPEFEVLKNRPIGTSISEATVNPTGIVTVSERATGRFLYKVRPGSETSIAFGRLGGGEVPARITDRMIQVGGMTIQNNVFDGAMAGVVVGVDGHARIAASLPQPVRDLLRVP